MKYILVILAALLIPACSDRRQTDEQTTQVESPGTVTMPAVITNVFHDGHLYILVLYNNGTNGGSIMHSPSCPYDQKF